MAFAVAVSAQSQIDDGQIQVPTAVVQIDDGQIQVPTSVPAPLTTAPAPIVTVSSGIPVPTSNGTFTTGAPGTTPAPFTGAASILGWSREIAMIGIAAVGFTML